MVQAVDPADELPCARRPRPAPRPRPALSDTTTTPVGYGNEPDQQRITTWPRSDVSLPAFGGRMLTVNMRRVFQKQITSPWQYAIFYNDLLEVNPGAPMTIAGWVHTNNNLYTAGNGSGT